MRFPKVDAGRFVNGTLTDIPGIRVGHATCAEEGTGCTVVLAPPETGASVVVRGGGPGSRELQLLEPVRSVPFVNAILLAGGSAFGLAAADGVMQWLDERGIGHETPWSTVPIVPAAVLYDLGVGSKSYRPAASDGYAACDQAGDGPIAMGSVGAGTGATVGKWAGLNFAMKGGVGSASIVLRNGVVVAALAVTNPIGDVLERAGGRILAGARNDDGTGFRARVDRHFEYVLTPPPPAAVENTTLCVVATTASFSKTELNVLANMAHNGLARAVRPVNTPHDGDLVFALSSGKQSASLLTVGEAAADVVQAAIEVSVRSAVTLHGIPGLGG